MSKRSCIVFSVPKAGTNLAMRAVIQSGYTAKGFMWFCEPQQMVIHPEGQVLGSHVVLGQKQIELFGRLRDQMGVRGIFITRDPRDVVVSHAFYLASNVNHGLHKRFVDLSDNDKIFYSILGRDNGINPKTGFPSFSIPHIELMWRERAGWKYVEGIYSTTFEKLIGSKGGGSDEAQDKEIRNIMDHLEIEKDEKLIQHVKDTMFAHKDYKFFRKGQIGDWKNHLTGFNKDLFKKIAGQLVIDEGYEKDDTW